jgi:hypothetical protein
MLTEIARLLRHEHEMFNDDVSEKLRLDNGICQLRNGNRGRFLFQSLDVFES